MQLPYSASQWSALVGLRLLVGCHLLYLGLLTLGVLGWDGVPQLPPGSLLAHLLTLLEPASRLIAAAESVYGTMLLAIGCALVLGFHAHVASGIAFFLLVFGFAAQLPVFGADALAGSIVSMSEQIAACVALGVLLTFPTSRVFGLDALRPSPPPVTVAAPEYPPKPRVREQSQQRTRRPRAAVKASVP